MEMIVLSCDDVAETFYTLHRYIKAFEAANAAALTITVLQEEEYSTAVESYDENTFLAEKGFLILFDPPTLKVILPLSSKLPLQNCNIQQTMTMS